MGDGKLAVRQFSQGGLDLASAEEGLKNLILRYEEPRLVGSAQNKRQLQRLFPLSFIAIIILAQDPNPKEERDARE